MCAGDNTTAVNFGTNATGAGTVSYAWSNTNTAIVMVPANHHIQDFFHSFNVFNKECPEAESENMYFLEGKGLVLYLFGNINSPSIDYKQYLDDYNNWLKKKSNYY